MTTRHTAHTPTQISITSTLRRWFYRHPMHRWATHALLAVGVLGSAPAAAQDNYPDRPIRVVVPYTPGGVSDTVTRLITKGLADNLKTPVVVENLPGANGRIGSQAVVRSAADGYNFLVVVAGHVVNPSLHKDMTFSPLEDLKGVSLFGHIPLLMVSSAQLPPTNLAQYTEWAKSNPNNATFASSGIGSGAHLVAEQFGTTANLNLTHVPYKGMAPALIDLFSGQVSMAFDSVQTMMPQVDAGKLRALAITSAQRWPSSPDVPTMAELGYPTMTGGSWIGLLAPAGVPADRLEKISNAVQATIDSPEVHARLIEYGIDPVGGTPEKFDQFMRSESDRWAQVIKQAKISLE